MTTNKRDIQQLLHQHFPNFSEPELQAAIVEHGKLMDFEAGATIVDYGSYTRMVPLVISGSIKVMREDESGQELFLYYLQANEVCSMSFASCMTQKKSVIRAICEEPSSIIAIPVQYVDQWMSRFQSWKSFVLTAYDERMLQLVKVIDSIAFTQMDERILSYLQQKSKALQSRTIHTTHQQIANDLNASREATSRLLKRLEKTGKVELGRNTIVLL